MVIGDPLRPLLRCNYQMPDSTDMGFFDLSYTMSDDSTSGSAVTGRGYRRAGIWQTGKYSVYCFYNGDSVLADSFAVY